MSRIVTVRELRENLASILDDLARGEHVVVTRRGVPVARILPEPRTQPELDEYNPLRGSVLRMADDFDEPIEGFWEAEK